jgi:hypothetical protein
MDIPYFERLGALLVFFAFGLGIYLAPVVLAATPVAVWRRDRVHLSHSDFYLPLVPYFAWCLLSILFRGGKSLSNIAVEPLCLGVVMAGLAVFRLVAASRLDERRLSALVLWLGVLAAFLVWWLVPGLPE